MEDSKVDRSKKNVFTISVRKSSKNELKKTSDESKENIRKILPVSKIMTLVFHSVPKEKNLKNLYYLCVDLVKIS